MTKLQALIRQYVFAEEIPLKAKTINMICFVGMAIACVATLTRILMGSSMFLILIMVSIMVSIVCLFYLCDRFHVYTVATWLILIFLCDILFPLAFFSLGGIESGMTAYFTMSIVLIFLLTHGRHLVILLTTHIALILLCHYLSLRFPHLVLPLSYMQLYADHIQSFLISGFFIGFVIKFQNKLYQNEVSKSENTAKQLMRQDELLHVVNDVASILIASDTGKFNAALDMSLEMMARYTDMDRIIIWKNHMQDGQLHYTTVYKWYRNNIQWTGATSFPYSGSFPDWEQKLFNGESVGGPFHKLSPMEQNLLKPYGIQSILVIPVFLQESFWGFVSFDDCRNERSFSENEVSILRSGSLLLANALVRSEMTQQIQSTVAKLKAVVGNYAGIIWSINKGRLITTFNGLYLKNLDITPAFLEGKHLDAARAEYNFLDIIKNAENTFENGPQDWISEIGGEVYHSHTTPIFDNNGHITDIVGSTDNITDSIKLQKDLETAVKAAEAASRAKSDFLSNMSHEMRTPMNAIIGMTSIGKTASDIEKKDYCFEKIEDASTHLLGVINDVLDMSKIEANKLEISLIAFDFEKLLQKVTNVINFRVDEKQQNFLVRLDKNIPRVLIGDDQRLAQVITNLLSNAVKFTPEYGSISLNTRLVKEEAGLYTIQISVSDTGIGISPEQQSRLFKSFQQAESGISRKFGGTGLGLAISKRIVEMMGGDIWVESQPDQGSVFTFNIQVRRGKDARRGSLDPSVNWSNVRVLVVDDAPEIREYFKEITQQFGVKCDTAADGWEALALLEQKESYDIYFIDWKMPGMDGIELTRQIKKRHTGKSVVTMISATEWNVIEDEAKRAGVEKFLPKPLFPSAIADCLSECLGAGSRVTAEETHLEETDHFEGYRILLAEDMEINREIVLALLEPTLLTVDCAENGLEAVRLFSAHPDQYDMIFMDVQMPEMDGHEATRRIRALNTPKAAQIPIVAMTANVFREDVERCLASGMNNHLGKPLNLDEMLDMLRKYLPRRPASPHQLTST
jgi:signal transduction histidine kinase/DNA-binding response OmpR family regulator